MKIPPNVPLPVPPRPTPMEVTLRFWGTAALIVFFLVLLQVPLRYLMGRRASNSEDDSDWEDTPTDLTNRQGNAHFTGGRYRDQEDDHYIGVTPSVYNDRPRDNPYEAGVRGTAQPPPEFLNIQTPNPYRYSDQSTTPNFMNVKKIRKLIAQLNDLDNYPENEENCERRRVLQQQATELVMADPRYSSTRNSIEPSGPIEPPPAYSDV
ncbi:hypothetical protein BDN70DRAFT_887869, partial [Pholiota conissans]